ncbi:MAG: hypothetical protein DWH97_07065 [Planctomycetota bacterium]|nr:MAG: hypothetical protein DWH97_07065 [Planctomycetota bacterium]
MLCPRLRAEVVLSAPARGCRASSAIARMLVLTPRGCAIDSCETLPAPRLKLHGFGADGIGPRFLFSIPVHVPVHVLRSAVS